MKNNNGKTAPYQIVLVVLLVAVVAIAAVFVYSRSKTSDRQNQTSIPFPGSGADINSGNSETYTEGREIEDYRTKYAEQPVLTPQQEELKKELDAFEKKAAATSGDPEAQKELTEELKQIMSRYETVR